MKIKLKPLRSLRLCGEKIRKSRELTARFARVAECAERGKRQDLFDYQKDISDKIKNPFILPLRSRRLCGENSLDVPGRIIVLIKNQNKRAMITRFIGRDMAESKNNQPVAD